MMHDISESFGHRNPFQIVGEGGFSSCYSVTRLAVASIGAVGLALADLLQARGLGDPHYISVNRHLASLWFKNSIQPQGWECPPAWDALAGDYPTKDGWIRLHTNLPHHKAAALNALGCASNKNAVARAVLSHQANALETEIIAHGGVAAAMRSDKDWALHPQGQAIGQEPLIHWEFSRKDTDWAATRTRPLQGLRILDLTRVLAGPVATRMLVGFGADVLRIDPPGWDEANLVPDITLGKRCARLDLRKEQDRTQFEALLAAADIVVHGYRPGALEGLGYGADRLTHLTEVSLDAYGWSGPWAQRRGFDSLVQMSSGIAHAGMEWAGRDRPTPLPVQALDHATGYLMAAAALHLLAKGGGKARLSLARTAELLKAHSQNSPGVSDFTVERDDFMETPEETPWGPALRLRPALEIEGTPIKWDRPACELGASPAEWLA